MMPNFDLDLQLFLGVRVSNIPAETETLPDTGKIPDTKDTK